jgi:hypothetical protein
VKDPHVDWLKYRLIVEPPLVLPAHPPPLDVKDESFSGVLQDRTFTAEMTAHFPTSNEARSAVERFLTQWEIKAALALDIRIGFEFLAAHLHDCVPGPTGRNQQCSTKHFTVTVVPEDVQRATYPPPPAAAQFRVTPDVESMWGRYRGYEKGREPLAAMAYFCLTVVESYGGSKSKRENAAKKLRIDKPILEKLGKLTSSRGDSTTARKKMPVHHSLIGRALGFRPPSDC